MSPPICVSSIGSKASVENVYDRPLRTSDFPSAVRGTHWYPRLVVQEQTEAKVCFSLEGWASTVTAKGNVLRIRMTCPSSGVQAEIERFVADCM